MPAPAVQLIALVYAAAVLLRVGLSLAFGGHAPQIVDALDYHRLAVGLTETGGYITSSGAPSSLRPPLYPAMVALVYGLFGVGSYAVVSMLQGGISLLTMMLTHSLGKLLAGPRVGLLGAAIVGFYPSLLAFNCLLLSETLFTFLFTLSVWASARMQIRPDWRWAVVLGLALGFGALTRSILWACAIPILGFLLVTASGEIRWRIRDTALAATVFVVVLAPWAWRNSRVQETLTIVDVMGGRNVMMGNYEHTPLERSWATISDVRGEKSWHRVLANSLPDGLSGLTQGQIDKQAMRYGVKFFFENPGLSAKRSVVRFFNFWQLERTIVAGLQQGLWGDVSKPLLLAAVVVFCGSYALVILGAIFGFFLAPFSWKTQALMLLWVALPCAIHTIAFAHSRYHLPLIPILAIYSAVAIEGVRFDERHRIRRALVPAAIVGLVLVLGWVREIVMVDLRLLG